MAIDVSLQHVTHYKYSRRISLAPQTIRLRPAPHCRSPIHKYTLNIHPKEHFINWQQDPFGNYLARIVFQEPTDEFKVEVGLVTEIKAYNPFEFFLDDESKRFPFVYVEERRKQLLPYLEIVDRGPLLMSFLETVDRSPKETMDFLVEVNRKVYESLGYLIRLEPGVQTSEQTLELKRGSCRDFAWLLCQLFRHLGLASRFVSGYLIQLKADIDNVDGPNGPKEDFTDLHAWTEVYLEGAGWVGLDSTSGLLAGEGHIPLCCTPHPIDAAPVSGLLEPCESTLDHTMVVSRLDKDRRVTKPLTDSEWLAIDKLGKKVDERIEANEIHLTMGGEPTFVPADNIESESWSGEALGKSKYLKADRLLRRLGERFGRGSLFHHGQGKWYPGEPLPRWSMNCYWRVDGQDLVRDSHKLSYREKGQKLTKESLSSFAKELASSLRIDPQYVQPAYEDVLYKIWQKRSEPLGPVDLENQQHQAPGWNQVAAEIEKQTESPKGYVLPILFSHEDQRWISSPWQFSGGRLLLTAGDSSIGYRLPYNALPYSTDGEKEVWPARDPFAEHPALDSPAALTEKILARQSQELYRAKEHKAANGYVRTALCLEIKDDVLEVFMPPLNYFEHYLDLVHSIEMVADKLGVKVSICGYPPPGDRRVKKLSVTPDPGVIEVNTQPAKNWAELKEITESIYGEAHQEKLSTSRFYLDGRRVGTGGGNHIVLGSHDPSQSPFLRRPDLLRSMLTFWQHHPALSYLFAGEFIGPTSQAPRIDEARMDSLYELEIAFEQIEGEKPPFWIVDRLFRNLLIDPTGNTHRSEFCIDKMYSPQGEAGRLGLLELRGFEMPPHPQQSLLQGLLVRAILTHFWEKPYQSKLERWGTRLHDQFMLPYYLEKDLKEVLVELKKGGFDFDPSWFESFMEFRCPRWGQTEVSGMNLEIRHALEPWHVMGEDIYQGSVSRAVDSSVERIQVKVENFSDRYALLCNGRHVPLKETNIPGIYVAGVRYKAWQPSSGLHPLIGVHVPLTFDLVLKAEKKSVGGCRYHVTHPGGQNYETVPINENEAEARCKSRFDATGFTCGEVELPAEELNPNFPMTLDMRRHKGE